MVETEAPSFAVLPLPAHRAKQSIESLGGEARIGKFYCPVPRLRRSIAWSATSGNRAVHCRCQGSGIFNGYQMRIPSIASQLGHESNGCRDYRLTLQKRFHNSDRTTFESRRADEYVKCL